MLSVDSTTQEVFNHVVKSLFKQGKKSHKNYSCRYRVIVNEELLKCAAGHCIPDEYYASWMEGMPIQHIADNPECDESLRAFLKHHEIILAVLQDIHDSYEFSQFKERFADLATRFGLKMPSIQEN